jgi:NAD(P)-dependent dehydrogenase (short-subunit alcohol dehydrogenase family)
MSTFTDRTLVVSGGSRGIGLAIALGAAKHGANVVLLAKTAEPHPRLPGTVFTAVADVQVGGGKGVAVVGDVRKEEDVQRAVDTAVDHFGGVDIVINNASAIATEPTEQLAAKKFDLDVNGKCFIDSAVLAEAGVNDLSRYGGGDDPIIDIFVDKP